MKYILVGMSTKYSNEMEINQLVGYLSQNIEIERINFGYGDGVCLIHFDTNMRFSKLKLEVSKIMMNESPIHFLFKNDTKTSFISLPDSYNGMLDLDKSIGGVYLNEKPSELKNLLHFIKALNQESAIFDISDYVENDNDYIPELDDLLDKICQNGYNSLSLYEKEVLNTYSKNVN
jgi:hypothetical protein